MISDFKIFPITLLRQLKFGVLQQATNCLSVSDHFVGLALQRVKGKIDFLEEDTGK